MFAVLCSLLIVTSLTSINGLKIDINRDYFYHGKVLFCAQLQCTENIREDTQISALVNMSVYRISEPEGKILVASISESDSKLQDYKRVGSRVEGKISKTFSELDIFFSNDSDCNDGIFLCEIHYVNKSGSIDTIGKQTENLPRKARESFLMMNVKAKTSDYVKSVDTIADFLKSFEDPDRLKGADMTMSLHMSHSGGNITDKRFGPTDTELNNSFKQISSTFEDMVDKKIKNLIADFNETIKLMENKMTTKIKKEIDTHKLKNESLYALNEFFKKIAADSQKQTEQLIVRLSGLEEKIKVPDIEENFNKTFNLLFLLNSTMHELIYDAHYNDQHYLKCVKNALASKLPLLFTVKLSERKQALCDTKTDGGGWIVIQRRVKGDVNFTRNWSEYKNGFGSLGGDFWLGNDWISNLTRSGYNELRFDMKYKGKSYYAVYSNVTVGNEKELYRIQFTYKNSNVLNNFGELNTMAFSTIDKDNDLDSKRNCAQIFKGGWWYRHCHLVNVNGVWGSTIFGEGLNWDSLTGDYESLEHVEMKLRRE